MFFISPPFGNYINIPYTTSIRGSFTLKPRPGLIYQIYNTLYYSRVNKGWVNKIGLRNKGFDYALKCYQYDKKSIYSIAILEKDEVQDFIEKVPDEMNIEINLSCPNTKKNMIRKNISGFINNKRKYCVVKLSPLESIDSINDLYNMGFRQFHCSNTLPTSYGGLSGRTLIPYSLRIIKLIKHKYPDCEVIGGGGIDSKEIIELYKIFGADHLSFSSVFFNPYKSIKLFYEIINSDY